MPKKGKDKSESAGSVGSALLTLLIVLIWLGVIVALIKLDVGGLGSNVLRPVLKDVPILKEILPEETDDELLSQGVYPFTNIAEAITNYDLANTFLKTLIFITRPPSLHIQIHCYKQVPY